MIECSIFSCYCFKRFYFFCVGQKELYNTKKQNINLPSLGKNAKGQTVPEENSQDIVNQQDKQKVIFIQHTVIIIDSGSDLRRL